MSDSNHGTQYAEYRKLVPIIWTVLRLMGVYFIVVGGSTLVEDLASAFFRWSDSDDVLFHYILTPRLLGSAVYVAAGVYLVVGGRWLIEKVFLPAPFENASREEMDTSKE
jgi:hypothetical protein